ncbi:tRNA pseudouridine(55) synthase TruB [Actinomycetospora lemnae]|uniref:tRNA pseudouridine synthase B n=1 Tax=Actinomycetospora lemnae TaxID=3019891 RepID=A0ABT5SN56_9PSEU|nr:tRNA pseudouridine(55) synthase TruB [Actinomycetospora sp. DW7H6]MDD7964274.1 tRNA pseudouridine(55) synthase TruB [Actinomycetospora sp. DW7H6]
MSGRGRERREPRDPPPPGLLVVDKPAGWTSHDVVGRARRLMGTRKVGHAGTLDPMATGVLVLGVERATKLLGHLALDTKSYLATIRLGLATTTDDAEGKPLGEPADTRELTDTAIGAGIAALTGEIAQVPSSVSAIKVDGRRAYERARAGEDVVLEARPVTVSRFDVLASRTEGPFRDLDVLVDCSSGTYVRALARDLGAGLGVGGHLTALRRTRVGPFTLARARTLEALGAEQEEHGRAGLSLDLDAAVATAFPRRDADADEAAGLAHGRPLPAGGAAGTVGVFGPDGHVIGLVADDRGAARPVLVLAPA